MTFLKDPKTKKKSVSLTLLVIAFGLLVIIGVLQVFQVTDNVSIFDTLFLTCSGLYWGRRVKISKDMKELDKK